MPKTVCPRNHTISLVLIPTPGEQFYFRFVELDEIVETAVHAFSSYVDNDLPRLDELSDSLIGLIHRYVPCLKCGAIVFIDEEPPRGYFDVKGEQKGVAQLLETQTAIPARPTTSLLRCSNGHRYGVPDEEPSHLIMRLKVDWDLVIHGIDAVIAGSSDADNARQRVKAYLLTDVTELHECPICRAITFLDDQLTSYLLA